MWNIMPKIASNYNNTFNNESEYILQYNTVNITVKVWFGTNRNGKNTCNNNSMNFLHNNSIYETLNPQHWELKHKKASNVNWYSRL